MSATHRGFCLANSTSASRRHLVADLSLDKEVLKAVFQKNGWSLPA